MDPEIAEVLDGARKWTVVHGSNLDILRTMPDACVDSIVTDPPYGLTSREPSPKELEQIVRSWAEGKEHTVTGRGFMGRRWDAFVPGSAIWKEALRVLKPGGHLVAFAGSRTVDLMGLSIRLAGFEIRDQLQWLYGSGMAKGQNISKAIDEAAGAKRETVGRRTYAGGHVQNSNESIGYGGCDPSADTREVTIPATPEAAQWNGWGTGLSPSHEPIVLARKPLEGTVVQNVLAHGTGGLNVDATRIGEQGGTKAVNPAQREGGKVKRWDGSSQGRRNDIEELPLGRWPANIIMDPEAGAILDAQTGDRPGMSGGGVHRADYGGGMFGGIDSAGTARGDSGGPSRFFYCAKASRTERDMGLDWFRVRSAAEATHSEDDQARLKCGRTGAGRTGGVRCNHPTVKPIDLMRWLCRLVTPPGGIVLDLFCGSGTTGCAARLEGFRFIGAELNDTDEEPFVSIARARIAYVEGREMIPRESLRAEKQPRQVSLFEEETA